MSYILLGKTEALAPTSHKAKQEKLFNLILTVGSQPSSSFLGIETSSLIFSSLALIRALVICSVKAMLSELVWGSLAILCKNLITSERLQLSKSGGGSDDPENIGKDLALIMKRFNRFQRNNFSSSKKNYSSIHSRNSSHHRSSTKNSSAKDNCCYI